MPMRTPTIIMSLLTCACLSSLLCAVRFSILFSAYHNSPTGEERSLYMAAGSKPLRPADDDEIVWRANIVFDDYTPLPRTGTITGLGLQQAMMIGYDESPPTTKAPPPKWMFKRTPRPPMGLYVGRAGSSSGNKSPLRKPTTKSEAYRQEKSPRLLVFLAPERSQGIGNMLLGLYGAYTLAAASGRWLCVRWPEFNALFQGGKMTVIRSLLHGDRLDVAEGISDGWRRYAHKHLWGKREVGPSGARGSSRRRPAEGVVYAGGDEDPDRRGDSAGGDEDPGRGDSAGGHDEDGAGHQVDRGAGDHTDQDPCDPARIEALRKTGDAKFLAGRDERTGKWLVDFWDFQPTDSLSTVEHAVWDADTELVLLRGNHVWDEGRQLGSASHVFDAYCGELLGRSSSAVKKGGAVGGESKMSDSMSTSSGTRNSDRIQRTEANGGLNVFAHIRIGDGWHDVRDIGKNPKYIETLVKCLPKGATVLSDRSSVYEDLEKAAPGKYSHPDPARSVGHSAFANLKNGSVSADIRRTWEEWCGLYSADFMYRTQSGFSRSALLWRGDMTRGVLMGEGYDCDKEDFLHLALPFNTGNGDVRGVSVNNNKPTLPTSWALITIVNSAVLDFFTSWWLSVVRRTDFLTSDATARRTTVFVIALDADARQGLLQLRNLFSATTEGKELGPEKIFRIIDGPKLLSVGVVGSNGDRTTFSSIEAATVTVESEAQAAARSKEQRDGDSSDENPSETPKRTSMNTMNKPGGFVTGYRGAGGRATPQPSLPEETRFDSSEFATLTSTRPGYLQIFVESGYATLYTDVDVIFLKPKIIEEVLTQRLTAPRHRAKSVFLVQDTYPRAIEWRPCSCLVAAVDETAVPLLSAWSAGFQYDKTRVMNDQTILSLVTTEGALELEGVGEGRIFAGSLAKEWRSVVADIPVESFPPGGALDYEASYVREAALRDKEKGFGPFWVHANWRIGHDVKRKLLAEWGANFTLTL